MRDIPRGWIWQIYGLSTSDSWDFVRQQCGAGIPWHPGWSSMYDSHNFLWKRAPFQVVIPLDGSTDQISDLNLQIHWVSDDDRLVVDPPL